MTAARTLIERTALEVQQTFKMLFVIVVAAVAAGCESGAETTGGRGELGPTGLAGNDLDGSRIRALPMFNGATGERVGWDELLDRLEGADVVLLGEQHDDGVGHAFQTVVVGELLERVPGMGLSLEMLERDEQVIVDDWREGIITDEQFATLTFSSSWSGEGSWEAWYQPTLEAAKDAGSPIVAANAPRRYVRLARKDGYERLAALPIERGQYVAWLDELPRGRYWERFAEVMSHFKPEAKEEGEEVAWPPLPGTHASLEGMYRSQLVWDTTMAHSIAEGLARGMPGMVHLVGQFHSDFEGGLVQVLRTLVPDANIVVISTQRAWPTTLREEDEGRADVVVYTGERTD